LALPTFEVTLYDDGGAAQLFVASQRDTPNGGRQPIRAGASTITDEGTDASCTTMTPTLRGQILITNHDERKGREALKPNCLLSGFFGALARSLRS